MRIRCQFINAAPVSNVRNVSATERAIADPRRQTPVSSTNCDARGGTWQLCSGFIRMPDVARGRQGMIALIVMTALAVTEAVVAVALVACMHRRSERSDICDGLGQWRL